MATERLPCKLTEVEKIERAKESTQILASYRAKEDEVKNTAASGRTELKEMRTKLEDTARASREGWEYREVETMDRPDPVKLTIDTWRSDTGELVRSRPMNDDEKRRVRQPSLLKD